jgi:hypothetical protein
MKHTLAGLIFCTALSSAALADGHLAWEAPEGASVYFLKVDEIH